jgi:hypothetical protein
VHQKAALCRRLRQAAEERQPEGEGHRDASVSILLGTSGL